MRLVISAHGSSPTIDSWCSSQIAKQAETRIACISVFAVALGLLSASTDLATAASQKDWDDCNRIFPVEDVIAGCTRIINDASVPSADREKALQKRGMFYSFIDDYDGAIADYSELIRLNPTDFMLLDRRAMSYEAKGDKDHAIADYTASIRLNAKDASVFVARGKLYLDKGDQAMAADDFKEARRIYNSAIAAEPRKAANFSGRGEVYALLGEFDHALPDFNEAIRLSDKPDADIYLQRADLYFHSGDVADAIADYGTIIGINPEDSKAYYRRALAYRSAGDLQSALADYNKILEEWKVDIDGFNGRGLVYAAMGEMEKAISDFSSAIEIDPDVAEAYYNRAQAYRLSGNTVAALAANSSGGIDRLTNSSEPKILDADFMTAAIRLWREYFWPHARAALRQIGLTDRHKLERRVLRWVKEQGTADFSREDIRRNALGQKLDAEQTEELLDRLAKAGWTVKDTKKTAGRPKHLWRFNPKLFAPA
jgi:tetratricopeptide (TPR) repeat protein